MFGDYDLDHFTDPGYDRDYDFDDMEPEYDEPEAEFQHTVEEIEVDHEGEILLMDVTYDIDVDWRYDSGDPEVGIRGGWYARKVQQAPVKAVIHDGDGSTREATPEFFEKVKGSIPKLSGQTLDMALEF